jgi:hypothetical protein
VQVADQAYQVHGRLAQGSRCDVFLARREAPLTEMVILKVARQEGESLQREWEVLAHLHESTDYLARLLPQPVSCGWARCAGRPRHPAAVYRWRSGFNHTFAEARAHYRAGVDPAATVWMWNRLLEQLADLHKLGYAHRGLSPNHLLLHPRDHGLIVCGWSRCRPDSASQDLVASARCVASLWGSGVPRALTDLVRRVPSYGDALQLKRELQRVAREVFGPPRFRPFHLPIN